jgi:hypothetical protein
MSTMTTDRGMTGGAMSMGMTGMGMMPGMGMGGMGMMPNMIGTGSMMPGMMMPRCTITMEKMKDGCRMTCTCADKSSAMMLQQMCMMMQGGMCGCCMMMNGQMVCCCNMMMATCKCEMTDMGCMMTCTSGDMNAVKMMHACCDCMTAMMMPGMMMCMTMNGMPMCCMMM